MLVLLFVSALWGPLIYLDLLCSMTRPVMPLCLPKRHHPLERVRAITSYSPSLNAMLTFYTWPSAAARYQRTIPMAWTKSPLCLNAPPS